VRSTLPRGSAAGKGQSLAATRRCVGIESAGREPPEEWFSSWDIANPGTINTPASVRHGSLMSRGAFLLWRCDGVCCRRIGALSSPISSPSHRAEPAGPSDDRQSEGRSPRPSVLSAQLQPGRRSVVRITSRPRGQPHPTDPPMPREPTAAAWCQSVTTPVTVAGRVLRIPHRIESTPPIFTDTHRPAVARGLLR
jgi:hypothetical protein